MIMHFEAFATLMLFAALGGTMLWYWHLVFPFKYAAVCVKTNRTHFAGTKKTAASVLPKTLREKTRKSCEKVNGLDRLNTYTCICYLQVNFSDVTLVMCIFFNSGSNQTTHHIARGDSWRSFVHNVRRGPRVNTNIFSGPTLQQYPPPSTVRKN